MGQFLSIKEKYNVDVYLNKAEERLSWRVDNTGIFGKLPKKIYKYLEEGQEIKGRRFNF